MVIHDLSVVKKEGLNAFLFLLRKTNPNKLISY